MRSLQRDPLYLEFVHFYMIIYVHLYLSIYKCAKTIEKMWSLFGDTSDMEGVLTKLADKSVRVEVCKLIDIAGTADGKALELIKCTSDK